MWRLHCGQKHKQDLVTVAKLTHGVFIRHFLPSFLPFLGPWLWHHTCCLQVSAGEPTPLLDRRTPQTALSYLEQQGRNKTFISRQEFNGGSYLDTVWENIQQGSQSKQCQGQVHTVKGFAGDVRYF